MARYCPDSTYYVLDAAMNGDNEGLLFALKHGGSPNGIKVKGENNPPLHSASTVEVAQTLLSHGAKINGHSMVEKGSDLGNFTGMYVSEGTALHHVNPQVAQFLIDKGADLEARDHRGFTPLHCAVVRQDTDVAKTLIDAGADIQARETQVSGMTPLHLAAGNGFTDVGIALLEAGADPMARIDNCADPRKFNQEGATCIDYAEAASDDKLVQAMYLAVANRQAVQLESAWSPSSTDAEALMPRATHSEYDAPVMQRSRRL